MKTLAAALWNNSVRRLRFGLGVEADFGRPEARSARLLFADRLEGGSAGAAGIHHAGMGEAMDWRYDCRVVYEQLWADAGAAGLRFLGWSQGYMPGDFDRKIADALGIMHAGNTEVTVILWLGGEMLRIPFDLARPSAMITPAQREKGMVGLHLRGAGWREGTVRDDPFTAAAEWRQAVDRHDWTEYEYGRRADFEYEKRIMAEAGIEP